MQTRQPTTQSNAEPNPAWVSFFAEAMRLAELARQRRAAREMEAMNDGNNGNNEAVAPMQMKT